MDTAALWTQIGTGLVALAALVVSVLAFRRSTLGDRREHEHRDVQWIGNWRRATDSKTVFVLQNVGSTTAKKVRAQVKVDTAGKMDTRLRLGSFRPGKERVIHKLPAKSLDPIGLLYSAGPNFTLNWVSPLGQAEHFDDVAT